MTDSTERIGRLAIVAIAGLLAVVVGWFLFIDYPNSLTGLFGILLVLLLTVIALRLAGGIAGSKFPSYNTAEVSVKGPITRDGGGMAPVPTGPVSATADEIVEQVEAADEDPVVDGLIVRLNTPGGEVVPSDDIRNAVQEFEGPTMAYATDVCASGGYWIASGCDEVWARDLSVVGSIGVLGSRPNVADLAERLGVSYEQFTAGEYKDAGIPLKEIEDHEREYLQELIDTMYAKFVTRVSEGRDLTPAEIRDTEARIYIGDDAADLGLVDSLGTRDDVETRLEEELGESVTVEEFEPQRGPLARIGIGARATAYAFGAGVASHLDPKGLGFEFR